MKTMIVPAGTTVHIRGTPCELKADAPMASHPGNWNTLKYYVPELGIFDPVIDKPAPVVTPSPTGGYQGITDIRFYNGKQQVRYGAAGDWVDVQHVQDDTPIFRSSLKDADLGVIGPGAFQVVNAETISLDAHKSKVSELEREIAQLKADLEASDRGRLVWVSASHRAEAAYNALKEAHDGQAKRIIELEDNEDFIELKGLRKAMDELSARFNESNERARVSSIEAGRIIKDNEQLIKELREGAAVQAECIADLNKMLEAARAQRDAANKTLDDIARSFDGDRALITSLQQACDAKDRTIDAQAAHISGLERSNNKMRVALDSISKSGALINAALSDDER